MYICMHPCMYVCMYVPLSTVIRNSRDRQGNVWLPQKRTWISSSVIVSAEKTGNTSTGATLSMVKIYSRCLIRILRVKLLQLVQFKVSYFTTVLSA